MIRIRKYRSSQTRQKRMALSFIFLSSPSPRCSRKITFEHASHLRDIARNVRGARLVSLATGNGELARKLRAAPSLVLVTRRPGIIPALRKIKRLCTRGLSSGLYISWPICTVHTCHCWRFRFLCISTFVFNNEGFRVCICV